MNYKQRVEIGLCGRCGNKNIAGKSLCEHCICIRNTSRHKLRKNKVKDGKCQDCTNFVTDNKNRCNICLEKAKISKQKTRKTRNKNGFCYICGVRYITLNKRCDECVLKEIAYRILGTASKWPDLKNIFDKQKGRCPYSNIPLTLGDNAQLDHIVPKSKGGPNTINNIHWVDRIVNKMKSNIPEKIFLKTVMKIANNLQTD